ncbi:MAG: PilT/PilU family type 4a pilus ATPase [Coleofasciculaceae cyanobacterium RL_1_1]|nr:PilT/PilU family type 4a pilus ATPase [Coleofasciculaceae cyanobacterium RL_1_1]
MPERNPVSSTRNHQPPPPPTSLPGRPPANTPDASAQPTVAAMVQAAYNEKASDIHIRVGEVPRFRIRGKLVRSENLPATTPQILLHYLSEILTPEQRERFKRQKEVDSALFYPKLVRCRINCFETLTGPAIVIRLIPLKIPTIDQLRLPEILKRLIESSQGLLLVTGPTGSGKSTTVAAMIDYLNRNAFKHVISIEDPIEYVHPSRNCSISQREIGLHALDFKDALRSALREDPDVILIGEMRDIETINTAIQAAQTGHLVIGTLHTRSAVDSVNRLLNLYTPDEQPIMRIQIVESLVAVVSQLLLPTTDNKRVAVHDILINTPAMMDYLQRGEDDEAFNLMKNDSYEGMQILNQALYRCILEGQVAIEEAEKVSPDVSELERLMRTGGFDVSQSPREWQSSS